MKEKAEMIEINGSMKRSIERSGSPPRKRYSPYASPMGSPRVRSPAGSVRMKSPTSKDERTMMVMSPPRNTIVPKARTPRKEEKESNSPMKGVERPISPMREVEPVEKTPEYTPTPKSDQNKDYEECKKKVEEEISGAVKKYTIPKMKEREQDKEVEGPKDPRARSPRDP